LNKALPFLGPQRAFPALFKEKWGQYTPKGKNGLKTPLRAKNAPHLKNNAGHVNKRNENIFLSSLT